MHSMLSPHDNAYLKSLRYSYQCTNNYCLCTRYVQCINLVHRAAWLFVQAVRMHESPMAMCIAIASLHYNYMFT